MILRCPTRSAEKKRCQNLPYCFDPSIGGRSPVSFRVWFFDDRGKPGGHRLLLERFLPILILPITAIVDLFAMGDLPDLLLQLDTGLLLRNTSLRTHSSFGRSFSLARTVMGSATVTTSILGFNLLGFLPWRLGLFPTLILFVFSIFGLHLSSNTFFRSSSLRSLRTWFGGCCIVLAQGGTSCLEALHNVAKFVAKASVSLVQIRC